MTGYTLTCFNCCSAAVIYFKYGVVVCCNTGILSLLFHAVVVFSGKLSIAAQALANQIIWLIVSDLINDSHYSSKCQPCPLWSA